MTSNAISAPFNANDGEYRGADQAIELAIDMSGVSGKRAVSPTSSRFFTTTSATIWLTWHWSRCDINIKRKQHPGGHGDAHNDGKEIVTGSGSAGSAAHAVQAMPA
jgi:hypothetical protein